MSVLGAAWPFGVEIAREMSFFAQGDLASVARKYEVRSCKPLEVICPTS
jgi:hypothetical protein